MEPSYQEICRALRCQSARKTSQSSAGENQCVPYREVILAKLASGLNLKRIHQDLAADGITVHYDSLRRYVRSLGHPRPLPFRRMECEPGEEAQVDFGTGAPLVTTDGKRRKTYRLSHRPQLQPEGI